MNNKKTKSKIRLLQLMSCILFLSILSSLYIVNDGINSLQYSITSMKDVTEKEWRGNIDTYLNKITEDVLHDSDNLCQMSDNELKCWMVKHSDFLPYNHKIKNVIFINLGMTKSNFDLNRFQEVCKKYNIDPDTIKDKIIKACDENLKVPGKLEHSITEIATQVAFDNNMDRADIQQIIQYTFFVKDKVVLSYDNIDDMEKQDMLKSTKNKDDVSFSYGVNGKYWVEGSIIPKGHLGLNRTTPDDMSYKKILVLIVIDSNAIITPYKSCINRLNYINKGFITLFVLLIAITISSLILSFDNIIKSEGGDASDCDNGNNDNMYKFLCFIRKKIKRLRNG